MEDAFNLSLVGVRGHRLSMVPQSSLTGAGSVVSSPVVVNMSRNLTAPAAYRQNHSYSGRSTVTGSPCTMPHSPSMGTINEDYVRTSPPVSQMTPGTLTRVELVRLELPSLGSEFKGRAKFVDEVIELLDEMQQVHSGQGIWSMVRPHPQ